MPSKNNTTHPNDGELAYHSAVLESSLSCARDCLFHDVPVLQDSSLYSKTIFDFLHNQQCPPLSSLSNEASILHSEQHQPLRTQSDGPLVPCLSLPLCFSHSPFVLLVRRMLCPEELVRIVEELHGMSHCSIAHQLLSSVYTMAACSCLVWARLVLRKRKAFAPLKESQGWVCRTPTVKTVQFSHVYSGQLQQPNTLHDTQLFPKGCILHYVTRPCLQLSCPREAAVLQSLTPSLTLSI